MKELRRFSCALFIFLCFLTFAAPLPAAFAQFTLPPLPPNERLFWGQEPLEPKSKTRGEIVLNGLWKFLPAPRNEKPDERADWGYIRVPGDWTQPTDSPRPGTVSRGISWGTRNLSEISRAWYERPITIPESWQGRAILLDFERVSTDAVVYLDGIECGRAFWPGGTVDLSRVAMPGRTHTLLVKVVAAPEEKQALRLLDGGTAEDKASLDSRGLIGDVVLKSRPQGAYISDVFVQPSVRQKSLTLSVELTGVTQAGPIRFTARLLNERDKEEKRFTATLPSSASPGPQTHTLRFSWPTARLWDVGRPNLYTLRLEASGPADLQDEYTQIFGFREFWIAGRKFFLNGTEIHLRPFTAPQNWSPTEGTTELLDAALDGMAATGFNIAELWPDDVDKRGSCFYHDRWANRADNKGFALTGVVPSIHPYIFDEGYRLHWSPEKRDAWLRRVEPVLRRLRNHPSILMWSPSANLFGSEMDQDPRYIGKRGQPRNEWGEQAAMAGKEGIAVMRPFDPTRPIFTHQGSDVGDVFTVNSYLNLTPLQEREEWLSYWAQNGAMPYAAIEFGTPLHCTFRRGRNEFGQNIVSEPLMTEFSAIYLGADAYKLESETYRKRIASTYEGEQRWQNWHQARELETAPAFQAIQSLFITNTWRAWRTTGITGGMVPWEGGHGWYATEADRQLIAMPPFVPGRRGTYPGVVPRGALRYLRVPPGETVYPAARALIENNQPTLAWICGAPGDFTDRAHHFFPGGTARKQVALLNHSRTAQKYDFAWTVQLNKRVIARGEGRGVLSVGETRFSTIRITTGRFTARTNGEITLVANIGTQRHVDHFPFRIYPLLPEAKGKIGLYGEPGMTAAMLKQLGYTVERFGPRMTSRLIVVERNALTKGMAAGLGFLDAFVHNGGRLLIMEQDPEWIRQNLGLRVAPHLSRRIFPVSAKHPATAGIDATDLRDWTGASTLVPPYPALDYTKRDYPKAPNGMPYYGWHWGNRHAVSSAPIEKPHRSGWRPLLECEFDLAYSPLMELDYGKGRVILCTLDLEDHFAKDPAARKTALQVLHYALTAPLSPREPKAYLLGNARDAEYLNAVGVQFERVSRLPAEAKLILVGREAELSTPLPTLLNNGAKVFFLPRTVARALPETTLEAVSGFAGSLDVPDWPECRGLSPSDLRWRAEGEATLLRGGSATLGASGLLGRITAGNGVALFCQIDPVALSADRREYFRYTRWRQTRAIAQLLANLGATFALDDRIFQPGPTPRNQPGLYHSDYRTDFPLGDDPYRYYRW